MNSACQSKKPPAEAGIQLTNVLNNHLLLATTRIEARKATIALEKVN